MQKIQEQDEIFCPYCHTKNCRKHGSYTRTWFHCLLSKDNHVQREAIRYKCFNPDCSCQTFTIQEPDVLPYCRFLIPDLLIIYKHLNSNKSIYSLCKIFTLSWRTAKRINQILDLTFSFLKKIYQEITHITDIQNITKLFKTAEKHYKLTPLKAMWFRNIYYTPL